MVGVPLAAVLLLWQVTAGQRYELNPVNVTDQHDNFADGNSTVSWAPIPQGQGYGEVTEYHDGGLTPLYNLANGFIDVVQKLDSQFMIGRWKPQWWTISRFYWTKYD